MAATLVTTGVSQEVGVRYTYITDAEADWTNVPISTYFYDLETKLPYYKNADSEVLNIFASGGGDSIYTADGALTSDRTVDLDGNDLTFEGNSGLNIDNTTVNNNKALLSLSKGMSNSETRSTFIEGTQNGSTNNYWKIYQKGSSNFMNNNGIGFYRNNTATQGTEYGMMGISAVNSALYIANYTDSTSRMQFYGGTTDVTGNGYLKFRNFNASTDNIHIARSGKNFINPDSVGGFSDAGLVVMGNTYIGTEKISLQGSTLISEQLELSSTTDGFLMNRVTTVQKDAITNLPTNLMVFDTDLGTIERWDGFKWVTQSGTGALGISGAAGDYKYYPDYNTAITAALSGETIEQFGNIVETAAVTVTINKDITINMNGYSYTLDNAGTNRAFTIDGTSLSDIKILNGTINRINGTGGGLLNTTSVTVTVKPTLSLEGTTLYCDLAGTGTLLHVSNRYTVSGGLFKGPGDLLLDTDSTLTNFTYNGSGAVRAFRTGVNINNGYIYSSGSLAMSVAAGAEASNLTIETSGLGISNNGKVVNCNVHSTGGVAITSSAVGNNHGVFNCVGHSDTSYGIQISSGKCYNSVGRSTGLRGIFVDIRNDPQIVNCTGWSSAGTGIYCHSSGSSGKFVNCYGESELDTTSGHAFEMQGGTTKFINCTGKVKNSGAYGIKGLSATASIINFSGIGMASLFNGVTNAQIETTDAYGNVLVV